jgi:hypothetical protein
MKNYLIAACVFVLFGCGAAHLENIQPTKAKTSTVIISNSTDTEYRITVYNHYTTGQYNTVFRDYVKPDEVKEPITLRAGKYRVCLKSSGFWGRSQCFDQIVETEKEHQWKIKGGKGREPPPIKDILRLILSRRLKKKNIGAKDLLDV